VLQLEKHFEHIWANHIFVDGEESSKLNLPQFTKMFPD